LIYEAKGSNKVGF